MSVLAPGCDGGSHRFAWSNYDVVNRPARDVRDRRRNADNRYELFAIGYDDSVWHDWQTRPGRGPWSGWHSLGGKVPNNLGSASDPGGPRVSSAGGRISVFVPGTDNRLWVRQQTCANGCWGPWHHA